MKIITLWQPWATLIALGHKQYETRHWQTSYRGKIAIHAAKRKVSKDELATISYNSAGHLTWEQISQIDYPLGAIVAIADLTGCISMTGYRSTDPIWQKLAKPVISIPEQSPLERATGNWSAGRNAWKLENIQALSNPIPYRGLQGIGNVSEEAQEQIRKQLALPPPAS